MGHVVNPVNFRLGTVKSWNSNIFLDFNNLKYHGYFAVVSFNIYFMLSKIFRTRFFTYVTSYIFSHIKLHCKFNRILCFIFLFNGATEIGGYKISSLVSFFFPKQKGNFKKFMQNSSKPSNKKKIAIFAHRFLFETGFSYNFFYKMWLNKKLRYYGIYKPIMLDEIKRDAYKFLFKTKLRPETSTFQRFLFKHMMYKRKELRKKWNKMNYKKIKIQKQFRRFFIKRFLKYAYYIPINKRAVKFINRKPSIVSFEYYRNIKIFRQFSLIYGKSKLERFAREKYRNYLFYIDYNKRLKTTKGKFNKIQLHENKKKFTCFSRFTRSFKVRNFIFKELIFRSRRKRMKRRTYVLVLYTKFKFFINKFIKKMKFNIFKIFLQKLLNNYYLLNKLYIKYKKLKKNNENINKKIFFNLMFNTIIFHRKLKIYNLFEKGFNKININKFKIDLIYSKMAAYSLEMQIFQHNNWNLSNKLTKILKSTFKGFEFKLQFHFINIKNINAKIISNYIIIRLQQKYRIGPILRDIKRYCNVAKEIRGWKLTCAGRFSKKEIASYIVQKGGSFGYSSITSLLDYSFNSIILKYSICGIKMWLVLKKNFKKISSFKSIFSKILIENYSRKQKLKKMETFFKQIKLQSFILSIKLPTLQINKAYLYYNFKNLTLRRLLSRSKGFWAVWRLFLRKYKFLY